VTIFRTCTGRTLNIEAVISYETSANICQSKKISTIKDTAVKPQISHLDVNINWMLIDKKILKYTFFFPFEKEKKKISFYLLTVGVEEYCYT